MAEAGVIHDGAATARDSDRAASSIRTIQVALLVSLAYYVGAKIGVGLTLQPHPVSTLWPPNAILLAGLLLTPVRSWWIVLLAALPAHLAVELEAGIPLRMVLCWFVSNSSEALIGAGLIRWLSDSPLRFDSFRRFGIFVFGAVLATFLSCFLDAGFVTLNGWGVSGYWETWRTRFFSNVLATLTLVPVLVTVASGGLASLRTASRWRLIEAAVLATSLLIVCLVVFTSLIGGQNIAPPLLYAPLPLLLWAAVRFGPGGTSACLLTVALLAIWGATRGEGPFVASTAAQKALSMQLFMIVMAIPLMALAAVTHERARAEDEARRSEERLTLALSAAQMGWWEWQIDHDHGSWSDKSREIFGLGAPPIDFTLKTFLDLLNPEDRPAVADAIGRALELGAPYETEFRITHPDRRRPLGAGEGQTGVRRLGPTRAPARRERGHHRAQAGGGRGRGVEKPLRGRDRVEQPAALRLGSEHGRRDLWRGSRAHHRLFQRGDGRRPHPLDRDGPSRRSRRLRAGDRPRPPGRGHSFHFTYRLRRKDGQVDLGGGPRALRS